MVPDRSLVVRKSSFGCFEMQKLDFCLNKFDSLNLKTINFCLLRSIPWAAKNYPRSETCQNGLKMAEMDITKFTNMIWSFLSAKC